MNFEELLKKQKENNVDSLVSAAESDTKSNTGGGADNRIWKPAVDKAGNGYAVIRFLPAPDNPDIPWVKYYSHGFKGETGKWFIEDCPTSVGETCPVCEANSKLWNSGIDDDKEIARDRKRRLHYLSNILVLKDSQNPENEGKVFLYKYGAKIFSKLMEAMQPAFEDETPVNPFNLFNGANFKVKIKQVGGYWNYDSSEFDKASALFDGDEKMLKKVFDGLHPIAEFSDKANYKSYEELKNKLDSVLGNNVPVDSGYTSTPAPSVGNSVASGSDDVDSNDDDDDDMAYFKKVAASM